MDNRHLSGLSPVPAFLKPVLLVSATRIIGDSSHQHEFNYAAATAPSPMSILPANVDDASPLGDRTSRREQIALRG